MPTKSLSLRSPAPPIPMRVEALRESTLQRALNLLIPAALIGAAVIAAPVSAGPSTISGPARVIDGDTVVVDGVTVRLKGVDADERGTARGEEARRIMI